MEFLILALGLGLPWLAGYYWLSFLKFRQSPDATTHPALFIGYGFFVGYSALYAAVHLVAKTLGEVGSWPVFTVMATLAIAGYWMNRKIVSTGGSITFGTQQHKFSTASKVLYWFLALFTIIHLLSAAIEVFNMPLYPWDAWLVWAYRAKAWFYSANILPLTSLSGWLKADNPVQYTIEAHAYPSFASVIPFWVATCLGSWSETLINLPTLLCGTALGFALYGQSRDCGASPLTSMVSVYLLLSIPLIDTHLSLAGYADIWMAGFTGLGFIALLRGLKDQDWWQYGLAAIMILMGTQVKNEGLAWLYLALVMVFLVRISMPKLLFTLGIALALIATAWLTQAFSVSLPIIGLIGFKHNAVHIPLIGSYQLGLHNTMATYTQGFFLGGSWNLLWPLALTSLATLALSPASGFRRGVLAFFFVFVASQLFIFAFTEHWRWSISNTASNRLALQFLPVIVFSIVVVFHEAIKSVRLAARGDHTPRRSILPLLAPPLLAPALFLGMVVLHQAGISFWAKPTSHQIHVNEMSVVSGHGAYQEGGIQITGFQHGAAVISSGEVSLDAADYSTLSYKLESDSAVQPRFFWRPASDPQNLKSAVISGRGNERLSLIGLQGWNGHIIELGIIVFDKDSRGASVGSLELEPSTLASYLRKSLVQWSTSNIWTLSSINIVSSGNISKFLPLSLALSIWLLIGLACYALYLGSSSRRTSVLRAAGIFALTAWLIFDLKWSLNLLRTDWIFIEPRISGSQPAIRWSDPATRDLADTTRDLLANDPYARVLILSKDPRNDYLALRIKYHLLPVASSVVSNKKLGRHLSPTLTHALVLAGAQEADLEGSMRVQKNLVEIASNESGALYAITSGAQ